MNYSKKAPGERRKTGTARGKAGENEPVEGVEVGNVSPPEYLNETAKKWYRENLPLLAKGGFVKHSDLTAFGLCASAFADAVYYSELLEVTRKEATATGNLETVKDLMTFQRQKNSQLKTFLEYAKSLGLTGVDRGRIRSSGEEKKDAFSDLLD